MEFEDWPDGTEIEDGAYVQDEWYPHYGMTVTAYPGGNRPFYDGDAVVMRPDEPYNYSQVLMVPADYLVDGEEVPSETGGNITFSFALPAVEVHAIGLIDFNTTITSEAGHWIVVVEKADSGGIVTIEIPVVQNEGSVISTQNVTIDEENVRSITVIMTGPGAVRFLCMCLDDRPSASPSQSPAPSVNPSESPSRSPYPSQEPSNYPSKSPAPSLAPSKSPSLSPAPSQSPTNSCIYAQFCMEFEDWPDGTEIEDGAYVQDEWYPHYGMTVTAYPGGNRPFYDGDAVVMRPDEPYNYSQVLMVPADYLVDGEEVPSETGGNITFSFALPAVEVHAIGLIDFNTTITSEAGHWIVVVEKADSGGIVTIEIPVVQNEGSVISTQNVTIDEENVRSVTVVMTGPGAVSFLAVCVDDRPSASPSQSPAPSVNPSESPSRSFDPSSEPSQHPSESMLPSSQPSESPSRSPYPSQEPSNYPSKSPAPSLAPSESPSLSPGTVSGHLYLDTNGNGVQDPLEPNLPNVDVVVTDKDGNTQVVETDAYGKWSASVPPGFTTADIDENDPDFPDDVVQTDGTDPTTVTAIAGEDVFTDNDGFYQPCTISGHLYLDLNGNGDQDPGEPNLPAVDVLVTASNGTVITATTDANGNWSASVPPGVTIANIDERDPDYPSGSVQTEGTDPTTVLAVGGQDKFTDNDGFYYPSPSDSPSKSPEPSKEPSNVPSRSSLPSATPSESPSRSAAPSESPSSVPSRSPAPSQSPTHTCDYEQLYIDFEREPEPHPVGTELPDGAYVQNEWFSRYGMIVTAYPEGSASVEGVKALVVDVDEPHEKVLTIPTTGLPGQDEPNQAGGNITFAFDTPAVEVFAIGLIDFNPAVTAQGGSWTLVIEKADESGKLVFLEVPLLPSGGSSLVVSQNVTIDEENVRSVTVVMTGPGAVSFLAVCVDDRPSASPSQSPAPSVNPSESPSRSFDPSSEPSQHPSESMLPSSQPSESPSRSPYPSQEPSNYPSKSPAPSLAPSESPSGSAMPSYKPSMSMKPSSTPTQNPIGTAPPNPTDLRTSQQPSLNPSKSPQPSQEPSIPPSKSPEPSLSPSKSPAPPTIDPTSPPIFTFAPAPNFVRTSDQPSLGPSISNVPSASPSGDFDPLPSPTYHPTLLPTPGSPEPSSCVHGSSSSSSGSDSGNSSSKSDSSDTRSSSPSVSMAPTPTPGPLSVVKTFNPGSVGISDDGSFTITVINNMDQAQADIIVTDLVEPVLQMTGAEVTVGSGDCSSGQQLNCTVQTIGSKDSVTITGNYTVNIAASAALSCSSGTAYQFVFWNGAVIEGCNDGCGSDKDSGSGSGSPAAAVVLVRNHSRAEVARTRQVLAEIVPPRQSLHPVEVKTVLTASRAEIVPPRQSLHPVEVKTVLTASRAVIMCWEPRRSSLVLEVSFA